MRDRIIEWSAFSLLIIVGLVVASQANGYVAQSLFTMALMTLLSVGWNIISGFTGYVSFGQVSFFGFGAYVAAISLQTLNVTWYEATAIAAVAAALLALPLGMIMLRLNGIFFALGMFGLARILQIIANEMAITGGPMGSSVPSAESPNLAAFVMVGVTAVIVVGTYVLTRSRLGLRLMAVRDDSVAAQAAGVDIWRAKIIAFCASAGIGGIGGGLYAWNVGYIDPNSTFQGTIELQCVLMVLAGGIGTVWGPVIGGVCISVLSTLLWARFPMEQQIVLGGLTMFIAVAMPGGIMSALTKRGWLKRAPIWGPPKAAPDDAVPATPAGAVQLVQPALDCRMLSVNFGGVYAVNNVHLQAHAGEMLAIVGPNGAGKSTLFNLISCFLKPTAGQVLLAGRLVTGLAPHVLARNGVARTFQTSRLFPSLSVWETVLLAASSAHRSKAQAIAETTRILSQVELLGLWDSLPDTLPPGLQRLLEIARALALKPRVLLLDEAMAGMTRHEIDRVHVALHAAMEQGCAVVAIEHVLPAIADLAKRVQVLDFGATIALGPPYDVLRSPVVVKAYMGADYEEEKVHEFH